MARARWFGAVAVASLLLIAGCSGNSSGGDDTTTTTDDRIETSTTVTTTTEAISTTTTAAASGAVSDLEGVRAAVVRIVGEGSFVDPEVGEVYNQSGTGSGFIIDESGLAVTNNHVVTGAAFLQVHVEGEDEPRNAKVLGVSECSDLAVIDIDGDGFPVPRVVRRRHRHGHRRLRRRLPARRSRVHLDGRHRCQGRGRRRHQLGIARPRDRAHGPDASRGTSGGPLVTPKMAPSSESTTPRRRRSTTTSLDQPG